MYKLTVKDARTEEEQVREFETAELAILYRDYHLVFGQWNSVVKWVEEKDATPEQQRFIIDEKTELVNGNIVRFYKLAEGMEIQLEEASNDAIKQCWILLRTSRDRMLKLTDWTQLPDTELSTDERKEYRNYRSYLRVLPKLYDDATIIQAKVYSFEDWKKGKR
jgi:hypothetical protein